jgi:hypothetical protein
VVFRFYLLTAFHSDFFFFGSYGPEFSKPPDCGVLVQIFNRQSGVGFRVVVAEFVVAYEQGPC